MGSKREWSRALLLFQTDSKPVQMMSLEAMFCMGNIDSINCKIIELPFQNKHLSMLILLPKDLEDESTGLEKVRVAGGQCQGDPCLVDPLDGASWGCGRGCSPASHVTCSVISRGLWSFLSLPP